MENQEDLKQLMREYGYPEEAINRFIQETANLDYSEVKKRIMPYQDITAQRS